MASIHNYYRVLGLSPNADKAAIKKAYRQLAMRYHPDKNPTTKQQFLEIVEAYEVLMGMRETRQKHPTYSARELEVIYETLQKMAKEKAREKLKERAAQKRKEKALEQAKEYRRATYTLLGLVIVGVAAFYAYQWFFGLMINRDKQTTVATVVSIKQKRVVYEFEAGTEVIEDEAYVRSTGVEMLTQTGLPLRIGNEFQLEYSAQNPSYHRINYQKVSKETLKFYLEICEKRLYSVYAENWKDFTERQKKVRAQCLLLITYQKLGLEALAQLYYCQENPLENFKHNSLTWRFFKDKPEFKEIQNLCESPL